jgi:hypothetical protein
MKQRNLPVIATLQGLEPPTNERVKYKLLFEDGTIEDVDQAARRGLETREQLLRHQEKQQPLYAAREEACAAEYKRQLQHMQRCWFEQDFPLGLRPVAQGRRDAVEMITDEQMKWLPEKLRNQVKQQIALEAEKPSRLWHTTVAVGWPDQSNWPDRHLAYGQHFEAWVAPEDLQQDSCSPDGWFWLIAGRRVEFPEG